MMIELLADRFMQHAFAGTLLAGIACALVGVLVVILRLSFIGVCVSHAAFTGALLGLIIGVNPVATAFIVSMVAAAALGPLADRGDIGPDTALGIVFSSAMGISFLLLAVIPGPKAEALGLLWGNVLTITYGNLILLAVIALIAGILTVLFYKEIQAVIFNRELALASGVPATAVFYGLLLATGMTVSASLSAIGGLLVFSLIVNPAAAAYQLTYRLRTMFLLSILFAVASGWIGLILSVLFNTPSGALIVVVSTAIFIVAAVVSPKRRAYQLRHTAEVVDEST